MPDAADLFPIRCKIDPLRQPRHRDRHRDLLDLLATLGISDPYTWNGATEENVAKLRRHPHFSDSCHGPSVQLSRSNTPFCYRVSPMANIVACSTEGRLSKASTGDENWEEMYIDYLARPRWLELRSYVVGNLSGFRSFTWWTTHDFTPDPVRIAHRVGLVDDWIPYHAVILRCPTQVIDDYDLGYRPSIVDAFDAPIFYATEDALDPPTGLSIDLEAVPLQAEACEFVCKPIPVTSIQCFPVPLHTPPPEQKSMSLDSLVSALQAFYSAMSLNI